MAPLEDEHVDAGAGEPPARAESVTPPSDDDDRAPCRSLMTPIIVLSLGLDKARLQRRELAGGM